MNKNYLKVKVEGKNVNNFIKWLILKKINIVKLNIIKHNELNILIDYKDYELLTKYSKTYKITIIKKYGKLRLFDEIKNNSIILFCIVISIFFLYILSNIIFSIEIVYNDKEMVNFLYKELEKYDIKKYKFKKKSKYLNDIKEKILKENNDILEWIEIEESGTKYIIKLVERKKEIETKQYKYQSIISTKNAIIKNIKAYSGEKVKNINDYVKEGETVISGILTKPDETNIYKKASGMILGEVWYKVDVEYPLYYQEEKVTGKSKEIISIEFLNIEIPIFPYKKYKQFKSNSKIIVEDNIIPLKILKKELHEVMIKEEIYTIDEVENKAIESSKKKILEGNKKIIEINDVQILTKQNLNSKIKLQLFISVTENITSIQEIIPEEENNKEKKEE